MENRYACAPEHVAGMRTAELRERFLVEKMAFKDINLDLPARRIEIAEVTNSGTRARMLRDKNGKIIKENDHLMDAMRYLFNNMRRAKSLEQISTRRTINTGRSYNV